MSAERLKCIPMFHLDSDERLYVPHHRPMFHSGSDERLYVPHHRPMFHSGSDERLYVPHHRPMFHSGSYERLYVPHHRPMFHLDSYERLYVPHHRPMFHSGSDERLCGLCKSGLLYFFFRSSSHFPLHKQTPLFLPCKSFLLVAAIFLLTSCGFWAYSAAVFHDSYPEYGLLYPFLLSCPMVFGIFPAVDGRWLAARRGGG